MSVTSARATRPASSRPTRPASSKSPARAATTTASPADAAATRDASRDTPRARSDRQHDDPQCRGHERPPRQGEVQRSGCGRRRGRTDRRTPARRPGRKTEPEQERRRSEDPRRIRVADRELEPVVRRPGADHVLDETAPRDEPRAGEDSEHEVVRPPPRDGEKRRCGCTGIEQRALGLEDRRIRGDRPGSRRCGPHREGRQARPRAAAHARSSSTRSARIATAATAIASTSSTAPQVRGKYPPLDHATATMTAAGTTTVARRAGTIRNRTAADPKARNANDSVHKKH